MRLGQLMLTCAIVLLLPGSANAEALRAEPKVVLPDFIPQLGDVYPFESTDGQPRQYPITVPEERQVIDTWLEERLGLAIVLPDLKSVIIFQCWIKTTCCISSQLSGCTDFIFACTTNNGTWHSKDGGQTATCTY